MRTTLLLAMALCASPAFAEPVFVSGNCDGGGTWWTVLEKDANGNTICETTRNCDGDILSNCPEDEEDPGQWGGIYYQPTGGYSVFTYPNGTDTVWAVYEYNSSGTLLGRVYKNGNDHLIHSSFDNQGVDGIAPQRDRNDSDRGFHLDSGEVPDVRRAPDMRLNDVPRGEAVQRTGAKRTIR